MNERIEQLVEQARRYANEYVEDEVEKQFYKKFVELIVKECAELVKDFFQEDEFTCYNAKTEIKKHFGVKE